MARIGTWTINRSFYFYRYLFWVGIISIYVLFTHSTSRQSSFQFWEDLFIKLFCHPIFIILYYYKSKFYPNLLSFQINFSCNGEGGGGGGCGLFWNLHICCCRNLHERVHPKDLLWYMIRLIGIKMWNWRNGGRTAENCLFQSISFFVWLVTWRYGI